MRRSDTSMLLLARSSALPMPPPGRLKSADAVWRVRNQSRAKEIAKMEGKRENTGKGDLSRVRRIDPENRNRLLQGYADIDNVAYNLQATFAEPSRNGPIFRVTVH